MARKTSATPLGEMSSRAWRLPLAVALLAAVAVVFPDRNLSFQLAEAASCSPSESSYNSGGSTTFVQTFTSGTNCTWSVPTNATNINLLVVGGGGGGGPDGGSGGGGGEVAYSTSSLSLAGTTLTISVGSGGTAGVWGG